MDKYSKTIPGSKVPVQVLAILLVLAGHIAFIQAGVQGCNIPTILRSLMHAIPLTAPVLAVPWCNGLIGYLAALSVTAVAYRNQNTKLIAVLAGTALLDCAYRILALKDPQWGWILPAWNSATTLVIAAPFILYNYFKGIPTQQSVQH